MFNLWGSADLRYAYYQGRVGVGVQRGQLAAAYFIPTVVVPLLLIAHGQVFWLLRGVTVRPHRVTASVLPDKPLKLTAAGVVWGQDRRRRPVGGKVYRARPQPSRDPPGGESPFKFESCSPPFLRESTTSSS